MVRALKPVRTGMTGGVITQICAAMTAFGAYVVRVGAGTAKAAPVEDTSNGIGFALEDPVKHTYDGFYDAGDPIPVATSGIVNALVTTIDDTDIVAGDYLEVVAVSIGTQSAPCGILAEAGAGAGEVKTLTSVAQAMEDVTLGSAAYTQTFDNIASGNTTITGVAASFIGVLGVGDYILLRDVDGNCQVNRVKSLTSSTIGLLIPATVGLTKDTDYLHAVKQIMVKIL